MNIQYFHARKYNSDIIKDSYSMLARGGETFALIVPPHATGRTQIMLGRAKCHPDDNYNKTLGRTISTARLKLVDATVIIAGNDAISIFLDDGVIIKVMYNRIREIIYS